MHNRYVITGFLLLMVLAACSMRPIADSNMEREHIEAISESSEDWMQLGPGFRYYERPGGIGFSIDYLSIDEATLAALEAKMQQVESLMKLEPQARAIYSQGWSDILQEVSSNVDLMAAAGVFPYSARGELHIQSAYRCEARATAMPNSGSPGAKGYATARCDPMFAGNNAVRSVNTSVTARAGNDWPPTASDSGRWDAQSFNIAFGTFNCFSSVRAWVVNNMGWNIRFASSQNDRCRP